MSWSIEDHDHGADRLEYARIKARFPELVTVGFESLGGWFPLLERMFAEIREAIPPGREHEWNVRQIKEKFGGLRVYWDFGSAHRKLRGEEAVAEVDRIRRQIDMAVTLAEFRADRTCDVCGSPGWHVVRGRPQGWHMTRCRAHADGGLPSGEPSRRRGALEYDEQADELYDLSGLSLAQLFDYEAGKLGSSAVVEWAVVGSFKGMSNDFDRLSWPGWVDPVPSHLRGRAVPWLTVRNHLHYPLRAREGFHPVTAWTKGWVLTVRRDINGRPLFITVPREPQAHRQELWS